MMVLVAQAFSAQAKVRLPHLIGDNMVLQQQTDARLWGWSKPVVVDLAGMTVPEDMGLRRTVEHGDAC